MTVTIPLVSQFYVTLGGSPAPTEFMRDLKSIQVDANLHLPDMFTIELRDPGFRWIEDALFHIGQEVKVEARASADERKPAACLIVGQITSLEVDFPGSGVPILVIHGYDRSHLLHRSTKVKAFVQSTDSDIASKIARENGLQPEVDSTAHVHAHIVQDNVSDFDFLKERARAVGYAFTVEDKKLLFKKPAGLTRPPVALEYGNSLLEFRPRLTVASQVKDVSVRGFDPKTKSPVVGHASGAEFEVARTGWGSRGSSADKAFGDAGHKVVTDHPISSQSEGDTIAKALLTELWNGELQAEGEAVGNPQIRPGSKLNLSALGTRFSGEYMVTSARHVFDNSGHYVTQFSINGAGTRTVAELVADAPGGHKGSLGHTVPGVSTGIVSNNNDPEGLGRVKVRFPWLSEDAETGWVPIASPMAGNGRGFYFLPEVNDEVLVAFEHGRIDFPYVIGALWNGMDKPPLKAGEAVAADGAVKKRVIHSTSGHVITLNDTPGSESVEIVDKTGSNKIVINSAPGKLQVEMTGDVEIKAGKNVKVSGINLSLEGAAKIELKAPQIEVQASGKVKITGPLVELN